MTLHYIDPTFVPTMPNTDIIKASKASLEKSYVKLSVLETPVLQAQVTTIKSQQVAIDTLLRALLVTVPVDLHLDDIQMLREQANSKQGAARLYAAEMADIISTSVASIRLKSIELDEKLTALKVSTLSEVNDYIEANEKQIEIQQSASQTLEQAVAEITAEKEILSTAMRITEDKTLWDEFIPLVKSLAVLDPKNPHVSAIRAAVKGASNILRIASESITYGKLVEARKRLQVRLDDHFAKIKVYKDQISTLTRQNEDYMHFQEISQPKSSYEDEVDKIAQTLNSFVSIHSQVDQGNALEHARSFLLHGAALSRYLKEIKDASR